MIEGVLIAFVLMSLVVAAALGALWMRARSERDRLVVQRDETTREIEALRGKYGGITDVESQVAELTSQRAKLETDIRNTKGEFQGRYEAASAELARVQASVAAFSEQEELQSFGLYKPIYDFGTSEEYKQRLDAVVEKQAAMVKSKTASVCTTEWSVAGDKRKGKQMTDRLQKLMLRAFNGESDAAIAKVRFSNASTIRERIQRSFDAINKLGETNTCAITDDYLLLKLDELALTHELAEKQQAEKEEQRRIREQMREEEAALREIERAQREAEQDEARYEKALERARAEMATASDQKQVVLNDKIVALEAQLAEAHAQKERAVSRAQMTRSGHVYVISNHGSFGEHVYKVGMTRRLDPLDRVRELGDASVPFLFDVHAIIYSDDAPGLENALHRALDERRVNLVNLRREFFHVTIEEIEEVVRGVHGGEASFVRTAVAEEHRKTVALRLAAKEEAERIRLAAVANSTAADAPRATAVASFLAD